MPSIPAVCRSTGGEITERNLDHEDIPPDATHFYGLTKRLGEQMCRHAVAEWHMSVNALRLCHPTADDQWRTQTDPAVPTIATAASDVAGAILAALKLRVGNGFQAYTISGDYQQKIFNMTKAQHNARLAAVAATADHRRMTTDGKGFIHARVDIVSVWAEAVSQVISSVIAVWKVVD